MKTLNILVILLFCMLHSCQKECPPFDRSLLVWIPYNIHDTLRFINNSKDTLYFEVTTKEIYDDECTYGLWDKCGCHSKASMFSEEINNNDYLIREEINYNNDESIHLSINVSIDNNGGNFSLYTSNINSNVKEKISLNGVTYNNIISIESDTIEYPNLSKYWKIVLAKNIGIIKIFGRDTISDLSIIE